MSGTLALVGGGEFTSPCEEVDRQLLRVSAASRVLVLPTAAAFEHPERAVANAVAWFRSLGADAEGLGVLGRRDAFDATHAEAVRSSPFTYLTGGSPMHLKSVLKDTPVWDALVGAVSDGGVLAGSSAGAMVLSDPMVDPRGGAFTIGLGLVPKVAVVPHAEQWSHDRLRRTLDLAKGFDLVTVDTGSALVREPDGRWSAHGRVSVYVDGALADLSALPSVS